MKGLKTANTKIDIDKIKILIDKEIFIETNGSNFLIDAFGFPREVLKLPEMIEQNKNSKVGIDKS